MNTKETWKALKLDYLAFIFGDVVKEWEQYNDDRRLYVNTYRMIFEGIESLPEEPNIVVKCAMNHYIDEELEMMKEIRNRFL